MERLTSTNLRKACNDPWDYCGLDNVCKRDCFEPTSCKIPKIVDRLAAYEDTGLEPEDLKRAFNEDGVLKLAGQALGITPERLRELAQTDKDGKIKAYIVDSFYCDICQKRHARTKEIEVYLTRNAAEAALRREQDG